MDTYLNLVNAGVGLEGTEIVLYQKNYLRQIEDSNLSPAIAWRQIRNCNYGWHHPFVYSYDIEVAVSDDFGNYSPRVPVTDGQVLEIRPIASGRCLAIAPRQKTSAQVKVINKLARGSYTVNIFRSGSVIAQKTSVSPYQSVVFNFNPSIWIGTQKVTENVAYITPYIPQENDIEIPLIGIKSADIIMSGGVSNPLAFALANINSG